MPTVILLDRSLSMKRSLSTDNGAETRLEVAKTGLMAFLSYLESVFPLEQVAVMVYSSACDMLTPFTRDHEELKEALKKVVVADKTDLRNALKVTVDLVVKDWGVFNPVQLLLVTDGTLGIADTAGNPFKLAIPFPCKLHLMLIAAKEEFSRSQERMEILCQLTNSAVNDVIFPVESLINFTNKSVVQMFLQLCLTHYKPVTSTLKCGHLKSDICFTPSPLMVQSVHDIGTSPLHQFQNPYNIQEFPSEIDICGFLDVGSLSAPHVYSKHFIIDADIDGNKASDLVRELLETNEVPETTRKPEADKPSFRVLLHGSLKCEAKVAVVRLGPEWFGFLSSASASSKKSNLILTVLFPKATLPWLGSLHYLGPKPPSKDPRVSENTSRASKDFFPVSLSHVFSYQLAPGNLHWVKEPVLQADVAKILRYSHKLPEKEASFIKELNKLRTVVFIYSIPSVIDKVCQILSVEETSMSSPQAKSIIQGAIQFLSSNHNPHEKLLPLSGGGGGAK